MNTSVRHDKRFGVRVMVGTVAVVTALSCPPSSDAGVLGVSEVEMVARLTGANSMNHTDDVGIGGTDLGHMVNHNGQTYFLFGDTFSGEDPSAGGNWRSNVMAYSSDSDPSDGILFGGWITNIQGMAREVIHSGRTSPITEIPTGAISIGDRIYAWYMAVNWWGPPGEWTANYAGLAYWQEGFPTFTVVNDFEFPGAGNFGMVAASFREDAAGIDDEHLYLWGTPAGRLGGVKLARVLPEEVADIGAYEYFGGLVHDEPTWVADEFAAPLVVSPTVGEMSVMYNQAAGAWTMLYLSHASYAIEMRQAATPWGPWSNPITVVTGQQMPGLYGSYMNPLYVENGGETIYFTMSLWNPYDVYLMRATLDLSDLIPGDVDNDGDVDVEDARVLATNWGKTGATRSLGDFDGDGLVGPKDASILAANWGYGTGESSAIPEPSTLVLLVVGAVAFPRRIRRRR